MSGQPSSTNIIWNYKLILGLLGTATAVTTVMEITNEYRQKNTHAYCVFFWILVCFLNVSPPCQENG